MLELLTRILLNYSSVYPDSVTFYLYYTKIILWCFNLFIGYNKENEISCELNLNLKCAKFTNDIFCSKNM